MRTYELDSIVRFGKCKGYTVREIYQYSPTYLEWLIEFSSDFYIEKGELYKLPKPTPYIKKYPVEIIGNISMSAINPKDCDIYDALEYLKNGGTIEEKEFKFSNKIFEILEQKKRGDYVTPQWESISSEIKNLPTVAELIKQAKPIKIKKNKGLEF
ncbi:MAG TPA: hypothetical protein VJU78_05115 [Chitinophagaceae bacterium]|nr:hypothetical protein [Chitinophagaceae bacterium]